MNELIDLLGDDLDVVLKLLKKLGTKRVVTELSNVDPVISSDVNSVISSDEKRFRWVDANGSLLVSICFHEGWPVYTVYPYSCQLDSILKTDNNDTDITKLMRSIKEYYGSEQTPGEFDGSNITVHVGKDFRNFYIEKYSITGADTVLRAVKAYVNGLKQL